MFWTLELAGSLDDAPWPATKEELIDYANRSGAPEEVIENLEELEDDGERSSKTTAKSTNPSRTSGPTTPPRRTSSSTRKNISAILSAKTTIKSLSINKIGGDLICLDNSV